MRSDNLKNHIKSKHGDLSSEEPEQICKSILEDVINDLPNKKSSKEETSMYKRKDPHSNGLDESPDDEIDDEELDQMIVNDDYKYTKKHEHEDEQKLKLGKEIYEIINTHEVDHDILRAEHKEALDLYTSTTS